MEATRSPSLVHAHEKHRVAAPIPLQSNVDRSTTSTRKLRPVSDQTKRWDWKTPPRRSPSATDRPGSLSRQIGSPNSKPHLMPVSRAFVDANSCVASFGKPLNPSNLHHFATPTIGQFGTAGH